MALRGKRKLDRSKESGFSLIELVLGGIISALIVSISLSDISWSDRGPQKREVALETLTNTMNFLEDKLSLVDKRLDNFVSPLELKNNQLTLRYLLKNQTLPICAPIEKNQRISGIFVVDKNSNLTDCSRQTAQISETLPLWTEKFKRGGVGFIYDGMQKIGQQISIESIRRNGTNIEVQLKKTVVARTKYIPEHTSVFMVEEMTLQLVDDFERKRGKKLQAIINGDVNNPQTVSRGLEGWKITLITSNWTKVRELSPTIKARDISEVDISLSVNTDKGNSSLTGRYAIGKQ